jgi:hypothetical protein
MATAAVLARQQQFQGQRERQHLGDRIDEQPDRLAFVAEGEEGHACGAQPGDQRDLAPADRPVVEPPDAHRGQAGGKDQHGASGQQRHQRIHHDAQACQRCAGGRRKRRGGPERRRLKFWISAGDVSPDQAERQEIDDEGCPQRRSAQHREARTRMAMRSPLSNKPPIAIPMLWPIKCACVA